MSEPIITHKMAERFHHGQKMAKQYKLRGDVRKAERLVKTVEMSKAGVPQPEIAKALGVCRDTVRKALVRYVNINDEEARAIGQQIKHQALEDYLLMRKRLMKRAAIISMEAGLDDEPGDPMPPIVRDEDADLDLRPQKNGKNYVTEELVQIVGALSTQTKTIGSMFGLNLPEQMEIKADMGGGVLEAARKGPEIYLMIQAMTAPAAPTAPSLR